MNDYPDTVRCDWCSKQATVYDPKPDGHVWYECPDEHLSLWDPVDRKTAFADEAPEPWWVSVVGR